MLKMNVWSREGIFSISSDFFIVVAVTALLLGGMVTGLVLLLGDMLGNPGFYLVGGVIGAMAMLIMLILRQNELATTVVIAVSLCVDWYLGLYVISQVMALGLLVIFLLARSSGYPWVEPRALWLWALFLGLTIFPAIRGALTPLDAFLYYPNVILGALIMFWLGTVVGRNTASIRRLFKMLSVFAVLIAIHTIIQATTGTFLFESSHVDAYLVSVSNYELDATSGIYRLGSFFIQPNFSGTFFAMMVFIPLGLFVESPSMPERVLYLAETLMMLPALLYTYSGGAWIATTVGVIVFLILVGRMRYRAQISLSIIVSAIVVLVGFPSQVALLLQHIFDPKELILRNGIWQTAARVIQAFPLTGVGLGHLAYLQSAEPYRVSAQYRPYDHPHNSYLEWGAMAGLAVLFVFLALLGFALWQALRNWALADARARSLLGAGIAATIALSVGSWSNQGWTLPPLAALGWVILGAISSPLLSKSASKVTQAETAGGQN